jgi:predicted nuclease with TOPRIM domain
MAVFITAESERLNMMIEELKQDKDFNQKKYEEYRAKTNQLKKQNDRLVAKVDSVNKAYQALQIEKQAVEENLEGEVVKNAELTDENTVLKKDVAVGSMLQLSKLNSAAYKVKGGGKETETNKASGATRIKACFTVAKNMIATKGERTVYMRVTTPDLKVIAAKGEANNTFSFNGQPLMFSAKQALFYEQDIIESCINLDKETDFVAGEYTVELYTEGYKLGETKVILK